MTVHYELPTRECPLGYPLAQVEEIVESMADFNDWMRGQTMAVCDGEQYDYEGSRYKASGCFDHPHGVVVYPGDLRRYLAGLPVID